MLQLLSPEHRQRVTLLTEKHLSYIQHPTNDPTSRVDWLHLRETDTDLSYPLPVVFTFTPALDGEVVVRELPAGPAFSFPAREGHATVFNWKIGTNYEWFVRAGGECSERRILTTDPQAPRLLYIDGISNVRDIGGFVTRDQRHRVRQDRIYRSSEMDTHVSITPEGIAEWYRLGVRTDLDLRGIKDEYRGPVLDEDRVKWINLPLAAYADLFDESQKEHIADSFRLLTREENYPLMVHCWGGIDRTGVWLYLLGGMLGVSEDDLGLDYEFSSFSRWNRRSRKSPQFTEFLEKLLAYGPDVNQASVGFLRYCGITDSEMDKIRSLLLEDTIAFDA